MNALLALDVSEFSMTPDQAFKIASQLVLPGWLLLVFLPRWIGTRWLVHAGILPVLLGIGYLAIVGPTIAQGNLKFSEFGSFAGVKGLFQNDWVIVAGWIHYLAFDLWTGAWEVRDSSRIGLTHLLVIPCLFLTFMLGPVGLLLYFLLRWSIKRHFAVE